MDQEHGGAPKAGWQNKKDQKFGKILLMILKTSRIIFCGLKTNVDVSRKQTSHFS